MLFADEANRVTYVHVSADFLLVWSSMKVSMKSLSEYFCLDDGMVDAGSKTRENITIKEYCCRSMEKCKDRLRVTAKILSKFRMLTSGRNRGPITLF